MSSERRTRLKTLASPPPSALEQALDIFLLDGQARNLSPRTVGYYRERLTTFLTWLAGQGVTDVAAITPSHVRAYLVHLREKGLNGYTQHTESRAVRAWLNFCVREDLLTVSPMSKVKMPKQPKDILPAFAPEDVKALLAPCQTPRDTALVLCLLDTRAAGLRSSVSSL